MYIKYFLIFFITLTLSAFAQENSTNQSNKGRVTGIGGIFFKVENPDSNKIELWEPNDSPFQKLYEGNTTK